MNKYLTNEELTIALVSNYLGISGHEVMQMSCPDIAGIIKAMTKDDLMKMPFLYLASIKEMIDKNEYIKEDNKINTRFEILDL